MELNQSVYFCFGEKPANERFATKTAKKKGVNIVILQIETFPKFQRWMKQTNIFKCKPAEVHFTIGNRVPYNKQLTNQLARAVLGNIGPRL